MAGLPLKLKGTETSGPNSQNPNSSPGTSVYALQEMSSDEINDGIIYRMLKEFAKVNNTAPKTGDLTLLDTVGDIATTLTGDFVDTTRTNLVGTRGTVTQLQSLTSTDTSVYQVLTASTDSIVRPVCYRDGNLVEMTDTDIMDNIISPALNRMTNRGLGSYHISALPPADPSTGAALPGTWTATFSVADRYRSGVVANTSATGFVNNTVQPPTASIRTYTLSGVDTLSTKTYTMWRKTEEATPPTTMIRPLKFANTAERGKHLVEMNNDEILKLLTPFRNAIITDGRGRYKFQESGPSGGTWARRGDKVDDLLNVIGEGTYTWGYATSFTGSFTGFFGRPEASVSLGAVPKVRTQFFADDNFYDGGRTASFTGFYNRSYTGSYTSQIAKVINRQYVRTTLVAYTTPVVSAQTLVNATDYLWVKRSN